MRQKTKHRMSREELRQIDKAIADGSRPEVVRRATALRLLHDGGTIDDVAARMSAAPGTINNWWRRWKAQGIEGLTNRPRKPPRPSPVPREKVAGPAHSLPEGQAMSRPQARPHPVQETLGLRFSDPSLLERAMTHRSYINEHPDGAIEDNERLEFLGDAVLDFITGEWLYNRFPEMSEGYLTRLRAGLVRTETLASIGAYCSLGGALRLGKGEEESGGRDRQANLCCAFEALIGALYLDQGMDAVRQFVLPLFEPALNEIIATAADKDAKSLLQEWSQATLNITPIYRTVQAVGPDHLKEFTIEVLIGETVFGTGSGRSKQIAAQHAAQRALRRIQDTMTN